MNKFHNPYADPAVRFDEHGARATKVLSLEIPEPDYNLVRQIRPGHGTMKAVAANLWKALCHELRKQGITNFSKLDDFEDFVANLIVRDGRRLPNGTTSGTVPHAGAPDKRRRASRVRTKAPQSTSKLPDVPSGSGESGTAQGAE